MQLIGLTGGIATGKSIVAKRMKVKGACVIDIDSIAKWIVSKQIPFIKEYCPEALNNSAIDRKVLARKLFSDKQFRAKLDRRVHPQVIAYVLALLVFKYLIGTQSVVLDIPLLFETGFDSWMSKSIVVHTERDIEIDRLCEREQIDREEAVKRIDSQMPLEEKCKRANLLIDNNGSIEKLHIEVDKLMSVIKPPYIHFLYWFPIPLILFLILYHLLLHRYT